MKNLTYILSAGIYLRSHKAFLLPTKQACLLRTLGSPLQSPFQGPKRDFKNRNRNGQGPLERQVRLGSGSGFPASPRPARSALGRPGALRYAGPKQPVAAAARRSAIAPRPLRPSEVQIAARAARPRVLLRVRAPGPERARGAGPRGLGGRERGTRGEGRAKGPARRGTWAPAVPPPGHFPFTPWGCRAPRESARDCRPPPPQRDTQARSYRPAGRRAGPRQAARGRRAFPPPRPAPAPNVPPPPVGASARAPAALRLPVDFRWQSCAAASRGPPRGPPPRRCRRPFRPPRGKAQPAAPLFYLPGVFARALAQSLAFPFSRSFSFFLSFFSSPRAEAFSASAARARPLAPSFLLGSAERGGRQLSPPPSTRAPAEAAAAAALRAPTHSNMARAQGACARAPPPHSALLPAARAPRAARVAPPCRASPS